MIGLDSFYKLKYIHRYTSNVRIHTENVAEHSFFVSCIALKIIALNPGAFDAAKVLSMALVHDWAEAWITDVSHKVKRDYPGIKKELKSAEYKIIEANYPEFKDIMFELDEGMTKEAVLVHYADVVQCVQYIRNEISLGNNTQEFDLMLEESLQRQARMSVLMAELNINLYKEL